MKHLQTIIFSAFMILALIACEDKPAAKQDSESAANGTNLLESQQRAMENARAVEGQLQDAADQRLRELEARSNN